MSTITTRSGKGAPLTNNEVDSNFTNLNADKAELSGATFTGEITANGGITFGDNGKATFGASDDLQIYHDGTDSFISDQGTGNLKLLANDFRLANAANNELMLKADQSSAVTAYYAGAAKLATTATGIDVTGTVTADGLVVTGTLGNFAVDTQGAIAAFSRPSTSYIRASDVSGALRFDTGGSIARLNIANNGDISFYEDTGTTAKLTWSASNEDLNFADNVKATFGDGDDLQVYHSGSGSFITDVGTGDLRIRSNKIRMEAPDSQNMIVVTEDAGVQAFYNGTQRLEVTNTGIDVTGTATMDGLVVEGSSVGGTYITSASGSAAGDIKIQHIIDSGRSINTLNSETGSGSAIRLDLATGDVARQTIASNGDISFYEDTGTTAKFFWDASTESLGIGTSSPATALEVKSDGASIQVSSADYDIALLGRRGGSGVDLDKGYFRLRDTGVTKVAIDSAGDSYFNGGNVGIGTSAPSGILHLQESAGGNVELHMRETTGGTTYGASLDAWNGSGGNFRIRLHDSGGTLQERMRIDASGNLLVGTTDTSLYNNTSGGGFHVAPNGFTEVAYQSATVADPSFIVNNTGVDGDIIQLRKDGTTVGSIGSLSGTAYIAGSSKGLRLGSAGLIPANTTGANSDANYDIGDSAVRFKDLYLSGGLRGDTLTFGNLAGTERMRISSAGQLFLNVTAEVAAGYIASIKCAAGTGGVIIQNSNTTGVPLSFRDTSGGGIGSVSTTNTTTAYNTSSDQRLKENIVDANDAGDKIDAIQVRQYDWKVDGSHQDYGMVAQELQLVAPEAVSGDADSEEMMGVDYSKLVPMLIKEIQSLRNRVAQLEA